MGDILTYRNMILAHKTSRNIPWKLEEHPWFLVVLLGSTQGAKENPFSFPLLSPLSLSSSSPSASSRPLRVLDKHHNWFGQQKHDKWHGKPSLTQLWSPWTFPPPHFFFNFCQGPVDRTLHYRSTGWPNSRNPNFGHTVAATKHILNMFSFLFLP